MRRMPVWTGFAAGLLLLSSSVARSLPETGASTAGDTTAPHLEVLGIVQDGGLPHAGCSCTRCLAAVHDPTLRRHVASLALTVPATEELYLIDATPDLRAQLQQLMARDPEPLGRVDRQPVSGVFLTHAHIGHYLGLAFFGYEAIHTSNLPVFASPRMAEFLRHNGPWSQLVELRNIELVELDVGSPLSLTPDLAITAIRAPHRDEYADTLGFLITGPSRSLFYLPDTDSWIAWRRPITELLQQVDLAVLDGTFYSLDELPGRRVEEIGHPLMTTSMDLLQPLVDTGGLEVYFTHLNHSNPALDSSSDARRTVESRGFHVLEEGQRIGL